MQEACPKNEYESLNYQIYSINKFQSLFRFYFINTIFKQTE